jgi:peptidoglycan-N-acetylglucosamine deacetylase
LVLECLARHSIQSTFFVMGRKAVTPEGSAWVRRESQAGHWIGNHTFSHSKPLGDLPAVEALREIEEAEQAIQWPCQPHRLFRPPGAGEIGKHLLQPAIVRKLVEGGYTCVLWHSAPGDWRDPDGWVERAIRACQSREWTLLALHDLPNGAMAHLETFLARLEGMGIEFMQEFPPDCLPILDGKVVLPLEPYTNG